MHFLSHYYTELPADNPSFIAGLVIPDLTPGFTKAYNAAIKNAVPPEDKDLAQVHSGVLAHYAGDKRFHNSPQFMQHTALALQSFMEEGLSREKLRLSVIAHLTVEMLIDRQIILENEAVCDRFYKVIVQAEEPLLETYFRRFALNTEKGRFLLNFQFFKERQFLYLFKDPERIVFGLNRIYASVVRTEFTEDEKQRFLAAIHNIDKVIRYSWQEILKDKL
jgi:hypothetical protein